MSATVPRQAIAEPQTRNAEVVGIDANARTVDLAFSSEAEVSRWYGIEILSHGEGSCDLSRLNDGGAVLAEHDRTRQIGVVEKAWIGSDFIGRARVRFSRTAAGRDALQDIVDGVRRHVSVGYSVEEMKHAGEHNGTDFFLVTRWQPYEISMVSVPADTSVGVGRSAETTDPVHVQLSRNSRNMPNANREQTGSSGLRAAISELMNEAENAPSFRDHTPVGMQQPTVRVPVSATRSMTALLSSENLVGLFDSKGRIIRTPQAAPSAATVRMNAALVANSRVARAGAGIIIMPEPGVARPVGKTGMIAIEAVPGFVRNVEAAAWSTVDVNSQAEIPLEQSPIKSVQIDWATATAKAVRFVVNRKDRMRYGDQDQLCDEIVAAITLGLARAADEVLLSALSSANLDSFTLAGAATQGLQFGELRALSGTLASGTSVSADGALRAAGVTTELTAEIAETIVGAWDRAAVAIRDDVHIQFQRGGLQGQMEITAWASLQAQVPDASKFWTVA